MPAKRKRGVKRQSGAEQPGAGHGEGQRTPRLNLASVVHATQQQLEDVRQNAKRCRIQKPWPLGPTFLACFAEANRHPGAHLLDDRLQEVVREFL